MLYLEFEGGSFKGLKVYHDPEKNRREMFNVFREWRKAARSSGVICSSPAFWGSMVGATSVSFVVDRYTSAWLEVSKFQ